MRFYVVPCKICGIRPRPAWPDTFGLERGGGDAVDIWTLLTPHFDRNARRIAEAHKSDRGRSQMR